MLTLMLILTAVSAVIELAIVSKVPVLGHLFDKLWLIGMFWSIGLSWFLGTIFGAAGLIALSAGLLSTCVTMVVYRFHLMEAAHSFKQNQLPKIVQVGRDVLRVMYITLRIITFPIWATRAVIRAMAAAYQHVRTFCSRLRHPFAAN